MNKTFTHPYKSNKEKFTIEELTESMLDGSDYERGSLETAQATADNVKKAFARLLKELRRNQMLTKKQAYHVATGYELKDTDL